MKKIFFSLVAIAALASCSKSEVQYEQTGEIAFSPIASNVTKSVAGYEYTPGDKYGTFDGVFPTDINLYVFANAQDVEYGNTWNSPYFRNALFKYSSSKGTNAKVDEIPTTGAYEGDPARYWPNVKTLVFAGVSKACNVNAETAGALPSMSDDFTTINLPDYTQNNSANTAEGTNDLMYFAWDGATAYGKQTAEIPARMQHACSWITINVYGDNVTNNYWTLNSLFVKELYHTGYAKCSKDGATWPAANLTNKYDEAYYLGSSTFNATAKEYATVPYNFIVIPQAPTTLDVTYTYTSDAANNITLTETKNLPLFFDEDKTAWKSGVHYIYNVKITATEILIDPVVVDWTLGTNQDTTI